ncbi:MAG: N-6 DNA methylase [Ilumatobacteraceae bacterium]
MVANWRTRFPTFPEPRIGGPQPLFDLDEVLRWLRLDGPRGREIGDPEPLWLWRLLVEAYARMAPSDARTALTALVAVSRLAGDTDEWRRVVAAEDDQAGLRLAARHADREATQRTTDRDTRWSHSLGERLRPSSANAAALCQLAATLDELREHSIDDVLEPVLDLEPGTNRRRPQRTQPVLARLMVALAAVQPDDTVLDPATGEGDVLLAAHRASRRGTQSAAVAGQDLSADASFIAATRLVLDHARGGIAEAGDSMRNERLADRRFSVVLLDPPVVDRPSSDRDGYSLPRWIDHAIERTRPGGRTVVVMPLHELAPVRAARRRPDSKLQSMLMNWWSQRTLETLVVLPRNLRADVVGPLAIVAMRNDPPSGAAASARVPVLAVRARLRELNNGPIDSIVAALDAGGTEQLRRFHHRDVDHEVVAIGELFDTLEVMTEGVERASVPMRSSRSSAPPERDGGDGWEFASRSTRRAAQLDPMMRGAMSPEADRVELPPMLMADWAAAPDLDDEAEPTDELVSRLRQMERLVERLMRAEDEGVVRAGLEELRDAVAEAQRLAARSAGSGVGRQARQRR